jgi:transcriptional regulator with XRE-family HTH domain
MTGEIELALKLAANSLILASNETVSPEDATESVATWYGGGLSASLCAEAVRGGYFVSEDWVAVGEAVSQRMRERGISQKQLAKRSGVSSATIRLIQHHPGAHRHTPRTLEAVSKALDWPPDYLDIVLNGRPRQETVEQVTADTILQSRLGALEQLLHKISVVMEQRLGNVVDVIYNSNSEVDITIEIKHARHDR